LEKAEKDRVIAEAKMKLWKTPTIGLARPVLPKYDPLLTHRGEGAFCEEDFKRKNSQKGVCKDKEGQTDKASGLSKENQNVETDVELETNMKNNMEVEDQSKSEGETNVEIQVTNVEVKTNGNGESIDGESVKVKKNGEGNPNGDSDIPLPGEHLIENSGKSNRFSDSGLSNKENVENHINQTPDDTLETELKITE
jgi:hypothetical protein